nr:MAG TPA: hypothetical protein [Caudoviricetes sp.]
MLFSSAVNGRILNYIGKSSFMVLYIIYGNQCECETAFTRLFTIR